MVKSKQARGVLGRGARGHEGLCESSAGAAKTNSCKGITWLETESVGKKVVAVSTD